jgi:3-polyprenyl-4-hydroxybenzoate decarboxylase
MNFGTRLLIDATRDIKRRRHDEYGNERFAPVVSIDEDTTNLVRSRWEEYGIK